MAARGARPSRTVSTTTSFRRIASAVFTLLPFSILACSGASTSEPLATPSEASEAGAPTPPPAASSATPAPAPTATPEPPAAAYGEACTSSTQCATGMCEAPPHCATTGCTCTKPCSMNGLLADCGGGGRFCAKPYVQGPTCAFVVDTGNDGDDRTVGLGVPAVGNIANAKDVDVFVFDAAIAGSYEIEVAAVDPGTALDVAVDVYGDDTALQFTLNDKGATVTEATAMTIPAAGRVFFAVRTANTNGGNYRLTVKKKS